MNNSRKIKSIYHELFDIQPNDTVIIAKYLENKKSVASADYIANKVSVPVVSVQSRIDQFQRLGLVRKHGRITVDRIGMGRFANSLRKQNTQARQLDIHTRGYLAVENQINNPQIDDVYYNVAPYYQRNIDEVFKKFQAIRTPEIYIKALIYFSKHDTCPIDTLIQALGANNDVTKVVHVMKQIHLVRVRAGTIYVNKYRLHVTIQWFISEGQKTHNNLLASNVKAIIAQQLFNFN